ncbi:MAG TPA: potassium transporter Kup [Burkholderiaceae bacterium]|nr:potassium transporter Kup [Burkholderiaceae bacterium]
MTAKQNSLASLMLGAAGIVYGDIGTSVLYALKGVFGIGHVSLTPGHIYGVLSLLFWMMSIIVTLKYVVLVLKANNRGEGGTLAMLALALQGVGARPVLRRSLLITGVLGASVFYGDGVITPAISVLSAAEGLQLFAPRAAAYVVPLTLCVLFALFLVQRRGTASIGRYFGPIMIVWFVVVGALGFVHILANPQILWAILPIHAFRFITEEPGVAFVIAGVLVLCVTGVEALYADMGHFGARPIRLVWFGLVMPALLLNYFGQGALLLADPSALRNPFYLMAPSWALAPLVLLATMCTVIASQALISGAFSITKQAIQLGYLPRLHIQHTSADVAGQIYIPFVNWALFVAVAAAVLYFENSTALASAYGVAVCALMLITTIMLFFVMRYCWHFPPVPVAVIITFLLAIDLVLCASAALKIPTGGWFALACGLGVFLLMRTWYQGRHALLDARQALSIDLELVLSHALVDAPIRAPGIAVFLTANPKTAPGALLHNLKHNKVMHEYNLFLTVKFHEQPLIPAESRLEIMPLGQQCFELVIHYGFQDDPDIPRELAGLQGYGFDVSTMSTSYFLGRDNVIAGRNGGRMSRWRKLLFVHMHRNAGEITDFMRLPQNATVQLGGIVQI